MNLVYCLSCGRVYYLSNADVINFRCYTCDKRVYEVFIPDIVRCNLQKC